MSVLKRMTDKFSNLGLQSKPSTSGSSPSTHYLSVGGGGSNPGSRHPSINNILYSTDHRGSISTDATSASTGASASTASRSLLFTDDGVPAFPKRAVREKGTYRLTDFIIHRTLGMGSFGRVHLGQSLLLLFKTPILMSM
jgi:hypothetical protein